MIRVVVLSALLGLAACNSVEHLQAAKTSDYTAKPKSIYGYIPDSSFRQDKAIDNFKKYLIEGMAECGTRLQIQSAEAPSPAISSGFDAVLGFRELASETVSQSGGQLGYSTDRFKDMYRLEFSLTALPGNKVVWKGQGDFRTHDNKRATFVPQMPQASAALAWSDTILKQMRDDGLLGPCREPDLVIPVTQ